MADQKPQPMVTVKKPDGTFVKVPLSELKKQTAPAQASKQQPAPIQHARQATPPAQAAPKPASKPTPAPVKPAEEKKPEPPRPAPVSPKPQLQIKQAPKPKQWTREDTKSPLEEKPFAKNPLAPTISQQRESQVDEAIKKLGFTVAPDIQNRLRSVIQLRLKDLRTEDETRETCQRPAREGGLDLSGQQADKLVRICDEILMGSVKENKAALPVVEKEELPSTAAPFNAFVHKKQEPMPAQARKEQTMTNILGKEMPAETPFKISSQPAVKPTMRDIAPPPAEMGPVDEIKFISLVDFRRLSAKPDEAAKRLRQKLYNLQDESILLYMDALDAYHRSPLYVDYVKLVCASLANRKPLEAMTQDKNRMQMSEIKALVEMEKGL
jgi:hypothetical protein